ncbi:MAG: glycosyltransferase [bacterium]|nr:glycosyltransferase [candidate division KSB1 bacterium]MDH7561550.1 glycosyltransferase [bacterium]
MTSALWQDPRPKKVLVVTYYFPPSGGAGVQRSLKFVKYLPSCGWQPVVLTARDADYPAFDPTLQAEVPPEARVFRTRIVEPYRLYRRLTGRRPDEAMDIASLTRDERQRRSFKERLAEAVRAWVFIPDARLGWLPFAVYGGLRAARQEQVTAIYSSAPPYTCHLIGLCLKLVTRLPWVADFRDSWVGWLSAAQRPPLPRAVDCFLEHQALARADAILAVSRGVADDLASRHPKLYEQRWRILPNGYDGADYEGLTPHPRPNRLVITYTGSLYGHRNPEALLRAVKLLIAERPAVRDRLLLRFVGRTGGFIEEMLRDPGLAGLVEVVPYVPHAESLRFLLSSDILLLIIDDAPANKGILTGKLYEYIGARKPILALAPEGEAAALIRRLRVGSVVAPNDVQAIKQALVHAYQMWQERRLHLAQVDEAGVAALDRRHLAKELAAVLDAVVAGQTRFQHPLATREKERL